MRYIKAEKASFVGLVLFILLFILLRYDSSSVQCQGKSCSSVLELSYLTKHHNTKPDEKLRMVKRRNNMRNKMLEQACYRLNLTSKIPKDNQALKDMISYHFYYSDEHKVLACLIPKTGCTNFKRVLLTAQGIPHKNEDVTTLAKRTIALKLVTNMTEVRRKLNTYYKLVIVREPLYRLLSAFRNKVEDPSVEFFRRISYRIHNTVSHSHETETATFQEYLTYITSPKYSKNDHWQLFHKLCMPCMIKYDFIGHLETIESDFFYLKNVLGFKDKANLPSTTVSQRTDLTKVANYYSSVPKSLVKKAYATYRDDYELFGFGRPRIAD